MRPRWLSILYLTTGLSVIFLGTTFSLVGLIVFVCSLFGATWLAGLLSGLVVIGSGVLTISIGSEFWPRKEPERVVPQLSRGRPHQLDAFAQMMRDALDRPFEIREQGGAWVSELTGPTGGALRFRYEQPSFRWKEVVENPEDVNEERWLLELRFELSSEELAPFHVRPRRLSDRGPGALLLDSECDARTTVEGEPDVVHALLSNPPLRSHLRSLRLDVRCTTSSLGLVGPVAPISLPDVVVPALSLLDVSAEVADVGPLTFIEQQLAEIQPHEQPLEEVTRIMAYLVERGAVEQLQRLAERPLPCPLRIIAAKGAGRRDILRTLACDPALPPERAAEAAEALGPDSVLESALLDNRCPLTFARRAELLGWVGSQSSLAWLAGRDMDVAKNAHERIRIRCGDGAAHLSIVPEGGETSVSEGPGALSNPRAERETGSTSSTSGATTRG